jgi:hypothetical protein
MLRALRTLLADHHLDGLLDIGETFSRAEWRVRTELPEDRPFARLTPELVARIAERYSASNEEFVREYLGGRHRSLFSVPTALEEPPPAWSLGTASERELKIFAGVVEEALNRVGAGFVDEARAEVAGEAVEETLSEVGAEVVEEAHDEVGAGEPVSPREEAEISSATAVADPEGHTLELKRRRGRVNS